MHHQHRSGDPIVRALHPYGVGIDCHSRFIAVCVLLNRSGEFTPSEREFPANVEGVAAARRWVVERLADAGHAADCLRYTLESTGCYHIPVMRGFQGAPSIVNPVLAGPTRRKTDRIDARLLAHHSVTGMWPESYVAPDHLHVLRCLVAEWRDARRTEIRSGNRVNNFLLRFGLNLTEHGSVRGKTGRAIVEDLLAGRCALPALSGLGLPAAVRPWFTEQYVKIDRAVEDQARYLTRAEQFAATVDWPTGDGTRRGDVLIPILTTVPGVKTHLALTWLAEVGDPTRFQNAKQVAAFVGSDPSVKVSAGKTTQHTRRKGNERLHAALLRAAGGRMLAKDCPLGAWGRSIKGRHKKGGYRKATSAISRRLACMLWQVHMRAVNFDPSKYSFGTKPRFPDVPIEQMGLGRSGNVFRDLGFVTSGQVIDLYYDGMAETKGVGVTCLEKVRQWLAANQESHSPKERANVLTSPPPNSTASAQSASSQDATGARSPTQTRAKKGSA